MMVDSVDQWSARRPELVVCCSSRPECSTLERQRCTATLVAEAAYYSSPGCDMRLSFPPPMQHVDRWRSADFRKANPLSQDPRAIPCAGLASWTSREAHGAGSRETLLCAVMRCKV